MDCTIRCFSSLFSMEFFVSRHETEWNVTEWNVLFFFCSFCKYLSTLHYLIHLRMSWCFYRTIILFSFSPCVWARTLSYLVQCTVYSRRLYIHSAQKRNEQCNVKTTDLKHVVYKVCVCVCVGVFIKYTNQNHSLMKLPNESVQQSRIFYAYL